MRIIRRNTLIVGTGAAGLNAADRLWSFGQKDLAVVTEGVHTGTSRNTGSACGSGWTWWNRRWTTRVMKSSIS